MSHDITHRIYDHECWPGADGISLPHREVRVHHHRMLDTVAEDGVANVMVHLLVRKLGTMDADHLKRCVLELLLKVLEVGKDVHAVDAAIRPKIQEDDLALQSLE